jgi:hypothetical protein
MSSYYDRYCDSCGNVKLTNGLGNIIASMYRDEDDEWLCIQCYDAKHGVLTGNNDICPCCGEFRHKVKDKTSDSIQERQRSYTYFLKS